MSHGKDVRMDRRSTLQKYQRAWEANAREDALYAVLSESEKRSIWNEDGFFSAGREEIGRVFAFMEQSAIQPGTSRFLDFGCGVGRNTRALMERFASGIAVDLSPRMISEACRYAGGDSRVAEYVVNDAPDLSLVPDASIDFVYSHIVLQHVPVVLQRVYIAEFARVLAPGGVAAFQTVTGWHADNLLSAAKRLVPPNLRQAYRRIVRDPIRIEMHALRSADIMNICEAGEVDIVASPFTNSTETDHGGRLEFFSKDEAIRRIASHEAGSDLLSQFFFVSKRRVRPAAAR
jgi:ubiquinone/menaquinone biosynthesis C-methylase UbiE